MEVIFESYESRLSEKSLYPSADKLNHLYLLRTRRSCTKMEKKKVMADFYSSIQNASIDASLFREGFLEEATEAERHDGDEIASPHQRVKKRSLPCSAPSIGNESDICSKTHVCASSLFVQG